jgi:hypothetical protein
MLESRLEQVVASVNERLTRTGILVENLTDGLSQEGAAREDELGEICSRIRQNDLSGLMNSLAGAAWMVAGIIRSTPWREVFN